MPVAAQARETCSFSAGFAASTTPAGRDWDLTTPGPWAMSVSPVLSQQCQHEGRVRPWVGVDFAPIIRHSYADGTRSSVLFLAHFGTNFRLGPSTIIGPHVVTNGTAWGAGLRIVEELGPKERPGTPDFELRFDYLRGGDPDLQGWVLLRFAERVVGTSADEERDYDVIRLQTGPEVGPMIGWRVEVERGAPHGEIGVRVGVLTSLFGSTAVQPLALAYWDQSLGGNGVVQLEFSAGPTWRHDAVRPVFGVGLQVDGFRSPFQLQLGSIVGVESGLYHVLDVSLAWVW